MPSSEDICCKYLLGCVACCTFGLIFVGLGTIGDSALILAGIACFIGGLILLIVGRRLYDRVVSGRPGETLYRQDQPAAPREKKKDDE